MQVKLKRDWFDPRGELHQVNRGAVHTISDELLEALPPDAVVLDEAMEAKRRAPKKEEAPTPPPSKEPVKKEGEAPEPTKEASAPEPTKEEAKKAAPQPPLPPDDLFAKKK